MNLGPACLCHLPAESNRRNSQTGSVPNICRKRTMKEPPAEHQEPPRARRTITIVDQQRAAGGRRARLGAMSGKSPRVLPCSQSTANELGSLAKPQRSSTADLSALLAAQLLTWRTQGAVANWEMGGGGGEDQSALEAAASPNAGIKGLILACCVGEHVVPVDEDSCVSARPTRGFLMEEERS